MSKRTELNREEIFAKSKLWDTGSDKAAADPKKVPSTHTWSADVCRYFRIKYYDLESWEGWICEPIKLPEKIQKLATWEMGFLSFVHGDHAKLDDDVLALFGDYVLATHRTNHLEAASDRLGELLLGLCNVARPVLLTLPQCSHFTVEFGDYSYDSTPDGGVYLREAAGLDPSIALLIVEDAKLPEPSGDANKEYQVLGEMIAAACFNRKMCNSILPQTIYAIRVMRASFTFYRVEIPLEYLISLHKEGVPSCDLVVFRWGGDHATYGFDVSDKGPARQMAITVLASVLSACGQVAEHLLQKKEEIPPLTDERIEFLYPSAIKKAKLDVLK